MANRLNSQQFHSPDTRQVGQLIENMNFQAIMRRRAHERRWYNNNFFDDGLHFRMKSGKTGQIIDHVEGRGGFIERAIPRASKQIRGIGSLLLTPNYYPVVYPRRVSQEEYRLPNGQIDQQSYEQALEQAKQEARKRGIFIQTTWEDELELNLKLIDMIILAAKHSISFLQVYTDPQTKRLCGDVFDAFDIICYGDYKEIDQLPFMTKAMPWDFNEVLASPLFEEERKKELSPDNQYATSEIKNAYMRARYGSKATGENTNSVIVRETFLKEYLSDDNWKQAIKLASETGALEGKSKGDMIMRHCFSAGGVTLADEIVDYDNYPFAELRFESGYLYQVPLIERFIPLNKTQDIVVTRIEKWINTMVTGVWAMRKNENFKLSNIPGGAIATYEGTPPQQIPIGNVGSTPFQFMEMIDKYLEEQGISATNLQQLPNNIANNTIENLQQQEYANMKFATERLKSCVTRIGQLIMERGDKEYIKPMEITYQEDNKPSYFSVIGSRGAKLHQQINRKLPHDIVTLDRKAKIRVEADMGFGLTQDGRRLAMKDLMKDMTALYQEGFLGAQAMSLLVKRFVEEYGFGSTEEFMEAIEEGVTQGQMSQQQVQQMKIALLQVLSDAGVVGQKGDKRLVESSKLGTLQTLKDAGLLKKEEAQGGLEQEIEQLVKLYKDAPDDVRRIIEAKLGIQPSRTEPIAPSQAESASKLHTIVKGNKDMELSHRQQDSSEQQASVTQQGQQKELELKEQQLNQPPQPTN